MTQDRYFVTESTIKTGGDAGIRAMFKSTDLLLYPDGFGLDNGNGKIFAENLTLGEARYLVFTTPEICYFTSSIFFMTSGSCIHDIDLSDVEIKEELLKAKSNVLIDRQNLKIDCTVIDIPRFTIIQPGPRNDERDRLLRAFLEKFLKRDGRIDDLNGAIDFIYQEARKITNKK